MVYNSKSLILIIIFTHEAERATWYKLENELHKRCGYFSGWPNPKWMNCDTIECTGPLTCSEKDGCQLHCFDDNHQDAFEARKFSGLQNHLADLNGCENTLGKTFNFVELKDAYAVIYMDFVCNKRTNLLNI